MTDNLHHLAAAYALDALDDDERQDFEAHYPSCDICSQEVAEFRQTAAALAYGASESPSSALKSRVMADISRTRQVSPIDRPPADAPTDDPSDELGARRRRRLSPVVLGAVAAAIVAVVGTIGALQLRGPSDVEQLIAAPDALMLDLADTGAGGTGMLRVVWSAERDELAVIGDGLADPGPNRIYELWFLIDEGVAPAGLFEVDGDGSVSTLLEVDDIATLGWGVTVEPSGGSDQPTSDVLFAGTF